jgi:hypothetical protein
MRKWIFGILCTGIVAAIAIGQQRSSTAPQQAVSRYQLVSATVADSNNAPIARVFMVNTETGCVWRYEPYEHSDAGRPSPEQFVQVPVSNLYLPNIQLDVSSMPDRCKR